MKTTLTSLIAALLLAISPAVTAAAGPVLKHCLVSAKDDVQVPAQEAGVVVKLIAERGMPVEMGKLLVQIDDTQAQQAKAVAERQLDVANMEWKNTVNERYAKKAAQVARKEYEKVQEADDKIAGSVTQTEIARLFLTWERSLLQTEQAQMDRTIAWYNAKVKETELAAAQQNIKRRKIFAPVDGQVEEIHRQQGEWVQIGDPVLRVIRLDELRVDGFVNNNQYNPAEVIDSTVSVEVQFAQQGQIRKFTFPGKIAYVSSQIQAGGDFRVSADVKNRKDNGQWLLRPGALAVMTITIK